MTHPDDDRAGRDRATEHENRATVRLADALAARLAERAAPIQLDNLEGKGAVPGGLNTNTIVTSLIGGVLLLGVGALAGANFKSSTGVLDQGVSSLSTQLAEATRQLNTLTNKLGQDETQTVALQKDQVRGEQEATEAQQEVKRLGDVVSKLDVQLQKLAVGQEAEARERAAQFAQLGDSVRQMQQANKDSDDNLRTGLRTLGDRLVQMQQHMPGGHEREGFSGEKAPGTTAAPRPEFLETGVRAPYGS